MLLRAVLGYAPSNLVPALVALATIVIFTRVLPPDEFGRYAVAQAAVLLVQALAFYGLQVAITRFYAARREAGSLPDLLATAYGCFAVLVVLAVAGSALAVALLVPEPRLAAVLWASLPLLALRGLVSINLAVHRSALAVGRHNLVECTQNLVGLGLAVLLVTVLGQGAAGLVLGLAGGSLLAAALDLGLPARHLRRPEPAILREVARFAAPLVLSYALGAVITYGDRLFLERLAGPDAVAVYAVAFGMVDRPVTLLFMAVTLAAFPLAVDRLERQGPAAAREQLLHNATALLALAVPAAVGLACVAEPLAAVVVGPDYRAGVAAILPWIAALALIQGLMAHYFGHAFHLANRTDLFVRLLAPAAVASLVLNPLLIPVWGLAGSLTAAFAAQGTALVLTAATARRVFPIGFPVAQALRVALAAAAMALAIEAAALPPTLSGLVLAILLGAGVYGGAVLLLDVAGIGTALLARLRAARPRPETAAAVRIFGIEVVNETVEAALARLAALMATPKTTSLFFVNAHTLNVAVEDPAYRRLLAGADLVFGDGTGVRWAARCRGVRMQANLNGTDLVPALLARGQGLRCFLLGHTPERHRARRRPLRRTWPSCTLVGFHHGYLDEDSAGEVIAAINAGDVDLLLVGMGNPLQERWIARHRPQLAARLCVGVGGLFSYWAGELDRAPAWMRRLGSSGCTSCAASPGSSRASSWATRLRLAHAPLAPGRPARDRAPGRKHPGGCRSARPCHPPPRRAAGRAHRGLNRAEHQPAALGREEGRPPRRGRVGSLPAPARETAAPACASSPITASGPHGATLLARRRGLRAADALAGGAAQAIPLDGLRAFRPAGRRSARRRPGHHRRRRCRRADRLADPAAPRHPGRGVRDRGRARRHRAPAGAAGPPPGRGGAEIGSHSLTHPSMARIPRARARGGGHASRQQLEEVVGREVTAFAYPYGTLADYSTPRSRRSCAGAATTAPSPRSTAPSGPAWRPSPAAGQGRGRRPRLAVPALAPRRPGRLAPGRPGAVARPAPAGRPAGRLSRPSTGAHDKARGAKRTRHRPPGEMTRTNSPSRRYPTSDAPSLCPPAGRPRRRQRSEQ